MNLERAGLTAFGQRGLPPGQYGTPFGFQGGGLIPVGAPQPGKGGQLHPIIAQLLAGMGGGQMHQGGGSMSPAGMAFIQRMMGGGGAMPHGIKGWQ